jgi:hypothetical protein
VLRGGHGPHRPPLSPSLSGGDGVAVVICGEKKKRRERERERERETKGREERDKENHPSFLGEAIEDVEVRGGSLS